MLFDLRRSLTATCLVFAVACGTGDAPPFSDPDAGDVVEPIGSDGSIEVATWNIENFPWVSETPARMAELITELDLDLIAVQEIQDVSAFEYMVSLLPNHEGVLSNHTYGSGEYQKVGFIYRSDLITVETPFLLFQEAGWEFPRPPLQVKVTVDDHLHPAVDFLAIAVHLKAGQDDENHGRRVDAMKLLEQHVRNNVEGIGGDPEVLVLGDFNQTLSASEGQEVFGPFLNSSYAIETSELAGDGKISHLTTFRLIDHLITTSSLDDETGATVIPRLDQTYEDYYEGVSDHLPVVMTMPILQ